MLTFQVSLQLQVAEDTVQAKETKADVCRGGGWGSGKAFAFFTKGRTMIGTAPLAPKHGGWSCSSHLATMKQPINMLWRPEWNERRHLLLDSIIQLLAAQDCLPSDFLLYVKNNPHLFKSALLTILLIVARLDSFLMDGGLN